MFVGCWLAANAGQGQVIVADHYNLAGSGTGFALGAGVNSGINPPTTRLMGTASANLRYISTAAKTSTAFGIAGNKLRVTSAANPGRFTLSADGTTAFNFAPVLGTGAATPQDRVVYEMAIRLANNSAGVQRFSFALGTAEGDATTWDFGIQVYRTTSTDNYYTIGKRIDTDASGLGSDLNRFITNTAAGTYGTEISLLMRVTDAGSESATFNSRVQLSMDGGFTWFYDTVGDPDLPNGWRLNGPGRCLMWDVAPDAGNVTYDDFSVRPVPVAATLISPQDDAQNLGATATLTAAVSNAAPGDLAVTFYGREAPLPGPGPDFCVAVLPDTQNYAREAAGNGDAIKEMWFAQTDWIITNRVQHNIVYVAHLGDIVQNGDIKNGGPNTTEWRNATNAMYRIENQLKTLLAHGIPYGLSVGNHDQEPIGEPDGASELYNRYFGVSHFAGRPYYGGHFGSDNDNHFGFFSASGLDFIVIFFEFGRYGSTIMNWANNVLATNQHRRCIAVTHYAGSDTTPSNLSPGGQAIFHGLKDNTNFFLMLGGHVFNNAGEGSRADNYQGRTIRTFISDYQGRLNGGNGWMRLMYFSPSNNLVTIKTYSPWLDQYETDANSQMTFSYNLQTGSGPASPGTPWVALGTNTTVAPGSQSSFVWKELQPNKAYEWYALVRDQSGNAVNSPARTFRTTANAAPVVSNVTLTVTGDRPTQLTLPAFDSNEDALTFRTNSLPLRGLNSNFDPDRGTITYLPAHGYRGLDRFHYQASDSVADSSVAMVNLNIVSPPDTNTNGLPDAWEVAYAITDPAADDDGDGQSNFAEYLANTNPTNAASVLKIVGATHQSDGTFSMSWTSVGGTRYRVQYADGDLTGGFGDILRFIDTEMDASPYGTPAMQSFTDDFAQTGAPTNSSRYYRLKIVP